jgi:hypothetical protein
MAYRLPSYHASEACSTNFQMLASNLTAFLTSNPPDYNGALNRVSTCEELRTAYSQTKFGAHDEPHQRVSDMLNHLGDALERFRPSGQPLQIQFADGPARFLIYTLNGNILQVAANGISVVRGGKKPRKTHKKNKKRSKTGKRRH